MYTLSNFPAVSHHRRVRCWLLFDIQRHHRGPILPGENAFEARARSRTRKKSLRDRKWSSMSRGPPATVDYNRKPTAKTQTFLKYTPLPLNCLDVAGIQFGRSQFLHSVLALYSYNGVPSTIPFYISHSPYRIWLSCNLYVHVSTSHYRPLLV